MKNKVVAIIQARYDSTRFPGKVLEPINGICSLEHILRRINASKSIDEIIIATSEKKSNQPIIDFCELKGIKYFQGSEENVLDRAHKASEYCGMSSSDAIVEITGDCPFIDPSHLYNLVKAISKNGRDYVSNCFPRSWPDGFDIQVYKKSILDRVVKIVTNEKHLSHCGWNILEYRKYFPFPLKIKTCPAPEKYYWPELGLTLDTRQDLALLEQIAFHFKNELFSSEQCIDFLRENTHLLKINQDVIRKIPGEG